MNLSSLLIWLSPLVSGINSVYGFRNTNEIDASSTSFVTYDNNDILDSFNTKTPFDLLEQGSLKAVEKQSNPHIARRSHEYELSCKLVYKSYVLVNFLTKYI